MTAPPRVRLAHRGTAVLGAVLAPVLIWLVADPLLGQRLRVVDRSGGESLEVGLPPIAVVALASSLAGWALLALLERLTRRGGVIWTVVALTVLALSFLPFTGPGMTPGTRISLALMHLAVAGVLIPGLAGARRTASRDPASAADAGRP